MSEQPVVSGLNNYLRYSSEIPVINDVDICVLGGSCTGVFAAVRAARLGARVAIVEKQNAFGGMATNALVSIWHSFYDTEFKKQIIAGLTAEMVERLTRRNVLVHHQPKWGGAMVFNPQELKIELDNLVMDSGVKPYLHTLFSEPYLDDSGNLIGVIVDNKSGRGVIKARYFVDATGDGDLCHRMGFDSYTTDVIEPATVCAYFDGWDEKECSELIKEHANTLKLPFIWGVDLPALQSRMVAVSRISGVNCAIADDLTRAEITGRSKVRLLQDMVRTKGKNSAAGLVALPATIGIRETRHFKCLYQVSDTDALYCKRFDDAIANGSYKLDEYHQEEITVRYLDGREDFIRSGHPKETRRWRPETADNPTFYQVPLRAIIPQKSKNVMIAGRMVDASSIAFGGIRVMVNLNQLGEAAGVATYLALNQSKAIPDVSHVDVRAELTRGGSIII